MYNLYRFIDDAFVDPRIITYVSSIYRVHYSFSFNQDWMKAFEEVKKRRQKELETAALKRSDTITQRER